MSVQSRLGTSIADDVAEFVPADADAETTLPAQQTPSILSTEETVYSTSVHCVRCYCDVAAMDRATGVISCPNCGWTSEA